MAYEMRVLVSTSSAAGVKLGFVSEVFRWSWIASRSERFPSELIAEQSTTMDLRQYLTLQR